MPRNLATVVADATAALAAGAISSQLDPRVVVAFATLTAEALGIVAARLDAIDPDNAAQVAAEVEALNLGATELAAELELERGKLQAIRADADAVAGALQTLRAQIEAAAAAAQVKP